ncbi:MAG: Gfo/Idh/MocA family protein [Alphaproteobacteria bacterium]
MARHVHIGMIGAGFIGRCHALGYRAMPTVFPEASAIPVLDVVCEIDERTAAAAARRLGFHRHVTDWRQLVEDPAVAVVDVCVPSHLHKRIALAAIAAGKDVYCEKPVGLSGGEASEIAQAAAGAGVRSLVGYSYLRNPVVGLVRKLIGEGALGDIVHFRGAHNEDYLADPAAPFTWRCDPSIAGAAGALGDLGGHIVSLARALVGEFAAVCGTARTVIGERPVAPGSRERRSVGNDDEAQFLVAFRSGATGHIEASRIATGSKMDITYEIVGTRGQVRFDGERMNELRLYTDRDPADRRGFRTILTGPAHPPYGRFVPGAGHQLGFNDHKVIEVYELMELIGAGRPASPDLAEAARIGRILDGVLESSRRRAWVHIYG